MHASSRWVRCNKHVFKTSEETKQKEQGDMQVEEYKEWTVCFDSIHKRGAGALKKPCLGRPIRRSQSAHKNLAIELTEQTCKQCPL